MYLRTSEVQTSPMLMFVSTTLTNVQQDKITANNFVSILMEATNAIVMMDINWLTIRRDAKVGLVEYRFAIVISVHLKLITSKHFKTLDNRDYGKNSEFSFSCESPLNHRWKTFTSNVITWRFIKTAELSIIKLSKYCFCQNHQFIKIFIKKNPLYSLQTSTNATFPSTVISIAGTLLVVTDVVVIKGTNSARIINTAMVRALLVLHIFLSEGGLIREYSLIWRGIGSTFKPK